MQLSMTQASNWILSIISYCCLLACFVGPSNCSLGDSYLPYRQCVKKCRLVNCLDQNAGYSPTLEKSWLVKVLWSCHDDCEYECMWPTVNICLDNGWPLPQFKGKWPFVRWLAIQEPASVAFSLLNLLSTLFMFKQFYRAIQTSSSMYWTWTGHAVVTVNAWTWSILFHLRDVPFTERMDYVGSSILIYYTLFALGSRIFVFQHLLVRVIFVFACSFFLAQHIFFLFKSSFDYRYNFNTLIFIGILTGVSTLVWCSYNYSKAKHLKFIAAYVAFTMLVALLEIFDFPPILWIFDAHSLWHLGTVPLPYFLYKFAIEDCRYLRRICHQTTVSTVD